MNIIGTIIHIGTMIKPINGIDKPYSELTQEEKEVIKNGSWGNYNPKTKTWSNTVFSGKTIRDYLQKRLQLSLEQNIKTYDSSRYYIKNVPYIYTIKDANNESVISFEAVKPELVEYPNYRYLLQTTIPESVSNWNIIKSASTALKNLTGVNSWYESETQYIIVPSVDNKTRVIDYIDFKDSLGGSLVDKFEITIMGNLAILHWNGASPLNKSDEGAVLTLKNQ